MLPRCAGSCRPLASGSTSSRRSTGDDPRPAPRAGPGSLVNAIATARRSHCRRRRERVLRAARRSRPDRAVFHTLRSVGRLRRCVGAGHRPDRGLPTGQAQARRQPSGAAHRRRHPHRQRLEKGSRLFTDDGGEGPLIITCEACPVGKRARAGRGRRGWSSPATPASSRPSPWPSSPRKGAGVVLRRRRPTLNGDLLAADVVDE